MKNVKVGDIVDAPTFVAFPSRMGSSRYHWQPAIIRKVGITRSGVMAVEADYVSPARKVLTDKFFVGVLKKKVFSIPKGARNKDLDPKYGVFFAPDRDFANILKPPIAHVKRLIKDYRR